MRTLEVKTGQGGDAGRNGYTIHIGAGALGVLGDGCLRGGAIVSDENVWRLHGHALRGLVGEDRVAVVPAGEKSKSIDTLRLLYSKFSGWNLRRNSPIAAFGGGVVGDLAGFAAATFMRGVPFIQIPTSLLAQVDSSVGGKVAVNLDEGKNLVGSFYPPQMVVSDTGLLRSLPPRELSAGLGEVVKHGFLGNARILELLERPAELWENMDELVFENCLTKAELVEKDEKEAGPRMFLNLGHTFGHAVEKYYNYETYNHGEAVAIGMALAIEAGVRLKLTPPVLRTRLFAILDKLGMVRGADIPLAEILPLTRGDKKNSDDDVRLILLTDIGKPFAHKISLAALADLFKD